MIRKSLVKAAIMVLTTVLLNACSRNNGNIEEEKIENLPTESLENVYGCTNTMALLSTGPAEPREFFLLIRNQEDFDKTVKSATCSPQVDFNKYTLLIGAKGLNSGCNSIDYNLRKVTTGAKDSLILDVTFHLNVAAIAPVVCYHALIPKQQADIPVKVNFEMKR